MTKNAHCPSQKTESGDTLKQAKVSAVPSQKIESGDTSKRSKVDVDPSQNTESGSTHSKMPSTSRNSESGKASKSQKRDRSPSRKSSAGTSQSAKGKGKAVKETTLRCGPGRKRKLKDLMEASSGSDSERSLLSYLGEDKSDTNKSAESADEERHE